MTRTLSIHFAENAYFVQRYVPGPSPEFDFSSLGLSPEQAQAAKEARRTIMTPAAAVTSVITDDEDLLELLGGSLNALKPEGPDGSGASTSYGYPQTVVNQVRAVDKCKESIQVTRLDEGFLVQHETPVKIDAKAAMENADEGEEWKGKRNQGLINAFGQLMPQILNASKTTKVLGFKQADEVLGYVKGACADRRAQ